MIIKTYFNFFLLPLQLLYISKMRKAFMQRDLKQTGYYLKKLNKVVS